MTRSLKILSIQVGSAKPLQIGERKVLSAINKTPIEGQVKVHRLGLEGDELHFPDCVLHVTQPRQPCFKFNAVMGDKLAAKKMAQTGFCGFYLSVLAGGSLTPGDSFKLVAGRRQTSIHSLFKASMTKTRYD